MEDQTCPASKTANPARDRRFRRWFLLVVGVAIVWRVTMAVLMPCLSRDGVNFCEYARNLGGIGSAYLADARAQQHPLFPLMVLGVHEAARACGVPDDPVTWQVCGQIVALVAGVAVVILAGVLTRRVWEHLDLPLDPAHAAWVAAFLAAVLPLNVRLSADAMSDQVHMAFYLAGACVLVNMRRTSAAALCGLLAGLAFLTRPEGAVVALGGGAALLALRRELGWGRLVQRGAMLILVFAVCAVPYWILAGKVTPKKSPLNWFQAAAVTNPCSTSREDISGAGESNIAQARLEKRDLHPVALLPWVLYETLRGGRVILPLLGVAGLLLIRWRVCHAALAGLSACFLAHLALVTMLQGKWGYLNPRHTLVLLMLLAPFAALALLQMREWLRMSLRGRFWPWVLAAALVPPAVYALRVPNGIDGYLRDAAAALVAHDPDVDGKTLLGASSHRRVAFYAGCTWQPWFEDPADPGMLRGTIVDTHPDYFAIETGSGFERERHEEIRAALLDHPLVGRYAELVHQRAASAGGEFYLYEFRWPED